METKYTMNTSLKILYKLTTRSRPEWAKRAIMSILDNEVNDNRIIMLTADVSDETMTHPEMLEWISQKGCHLCFGNSKSKIYAINRDINEMTKWYDWDILVNLSDDQVFIEKGFDEVIRNSFEGNTDQVLHFPDGNNDALMTMSIIGRLYFERDGYIYHPDYISLWCDNEAQEVAKKRKCYKFVNQRIFNHLHPAYGKAIFDEQYKNTESYYHKDELTYRKRESINFGL